MAEIILLFVFALVAGSWGWAMRGTVIGGEMGAMLPGMLFGICVSAIPGAGLGGLMLPLAAVGTFAMFNGGSATYGETLSFTLKCDVEGVYYGKSRKGYRGVFLNGALWFAVTGFFVSFFIRYSAGFYSFKEAAAVLLLTPFIQLAGIAIFNHPYDKEKGKFPKFYFSVTRREEWGSHLLFCICMAAFSLVKGDYYCLLALLAGALSGGIGFSLGLFFYRFNDTHYGKKFPAGTLQKMGIIGGWKIMEHTFGAVGFIGLVGAFMLINPLVGSGTAVPARVPGINFTLVLLLLPLAYVAMLAVMLLVSKISGKPVNYHVSDLFMRPLLSAFPMLCVFGGDEKTAVCGSAVFIAFVLLDKCVDGYFKKYKEKYILNGLVVLNLVFTLVYCLKCSTVSAEALMLITVIPYQLCSYYKHFRLEPKAAKAMKGKKFAEKYKGVIAGQAVETAEIIVMYLFLHFNLLHF